MNTKSTAEQKIKDEITQRAIIYLQKQERQLGIDFNLENAIEVANDVAFNIEVEILKASGKLFSFSGEDSCEDCAGWDGVSRRCYCGNRRVDWTYEGNFECMHVYAEAY